MKLSLFIFLLFTPFPGEKFVKVEVSEGVTVKIPESYAEMSSQDLEQRSQSYRRPVAIYTDPSRTAEFVVNFSFSLWNTQDLELLMRFYKASLYEIYSEITMITEEIQTINKREFVVLEFYSVSKEEKAENLRPIRKYTNLRYTLDQGRTILFNFTCPQNLQKDFEDTANQIMESIRIK
jgi:hypothetical protein